MKKKYLEFQQRVLSYYEQYGRDLPWRRSITPYKSFISEIMLQQTQTPRVIGKYRLFLRQFPSFTALARAPLKKVLKEWQGLGYNRRVLTLKQSAQLIVRDYGGRVPRTVEELMTLPGVGRATACAILAYAYNIPVAFIETNIRAVCIHHFFKKTRKVSDEAILEIVKQTLYRRNPRRWYWALMDYGTYIKKQHANPSRRSVRYIQQSRFEGSHRQVRGKVLAAITDRSLSVVELIDTLKLPRRSVTRTLLQLQQEGFIKRGATRYRVA